MDAVVSISTGLESNPNEYDDDSYTNASNDTIAGIQGMWAAGAEVKDIENTIRDALSDA